MEYKRTETAKRIQDRRKELGLTIREAAEKIGRVCNYYGDIERGTCGMSIDTLEDLASSLDVTVDYLLFGREIEEESSAAIRANRILRCYDEKKQQYAFELMQYFLNMERIRSSEKTSQQ